MDSISAPRVSIIIPCYNAERWVGESIESCLRQSYAAVEIIVIDDGSTDGSLAAIRSFGDRIRFESGPNRGACAARNRGMDLAHPAAKFLKFLDADDLLETDVVARQVEAGRQVPGCVPVGVWRYLRESGGVKTVTDSHLQIDFSGDVLVQWLDGRYCAPHALLWPRSVLNKIGRWDETLTANQDGDLFLRALLAGVEFRPVSGGIVYYRTVDSPQANSISARRDLESLRSRQRVLDKLHSALVERVQLGTYADALGFSYLYLARVYYAVDSPELDECVRKGLALTKGKVPGSLLHRLLVRILGMRGKELLAQRWHSFRKAVTIAR